MNQELSIGEQVRLARQQKKLSQVELANKCSLNIRTIQRIENNEVTPQLYTLRIIGDVLDIELMKPVNPNAENNQLLKLRNVFERRKQIRKFTFALAIFLMAAALFLLMTGIPEKLWAPFIYFLFFADFVIIGITWRCPGCNSLLGDFFNIRYCSKCGLKFKE